MNRVARRFLYFRGPFYGPDSFALAQLHQLNSTISRDRGWGITAVDFTADLTWFKTASRVLQVAVSDWNSDIRNE